MTHPTPDPSQPPLSQPPPSPPSPEQPAPTDPPASPPASLPHRSSRLTATIANILPHRLLFNPVFWKDTAISARKKGTFAFRGLYMLLLIAVVLLGTVPIAASLQFAGPAQRLQAASEFATVLSQIIQWTQFIALLIAGPILASGAISNERTSRSIDSLYATPLTRSQIMFGKLAARLAQLLLLALMPLPILFLLRALGGIEPGVALLQLLVTLSAATLTTSMGLFASVHSRRPWAVITSTTTIVAMLHLIAPAVLTAMSIGQPVPPWAAALAFALGPAYPFLAASFPETVTMMGLRTGIGPSTLVLAASGFYLVLATAITALAASMLRKVERPRARSNRHDAAPDTTPAPDTTSTTIAEPSAEPTAPAPPARRRPPRAARHTGRSRTVGNHPVLWREIRQPAIDLGRLQWLRWILFPALGIGAATLFFIQLPGGDRAYEHAATHIILAAAMGLYLTLASMTRTTPLIPHERSARTWDVLRTTPLTPLSIVTQKYLGSMAKIWAVAAIAVAALIPAVLMGLLHAAIIPMLALCFLQATGLLGATGLLAGAFFRKGLAATSANLGVALGLWILLPAAVGIVSNGLDQPLAFFVNINPVVQAGSTIEGCVDMARAHRRSFYGDYVEFSWPDESRTMAQHTTLLLINTALYAAVAAACLHATARRLRAIPAGT